MIKIFADSTCDLSTELLEKYNISIIPLYVIFDSKTYKDGVDITADMFFKLVEENNSLPKTSMPSPTDYYEAFKPYVEAGIQVLYISISSYLSGAASSANIVAHEFKEGMVFIHDSKNLSTGIGLQVIKAAEYVSMGLAMNEILIKLDEISKNVKTAFVIDTLDYLYKGGRCTSIESLIGGILKIKPIVKVVDGKMVIGQKSRGKLEKAYKIMLQEAYEDKNNIESKRIMVTHAQGLDEANFLKNELSKAMPDKEIFITDAGCVISSHCGKKTVGILYIKKHQ
ncbi:MAG TPA: DegV family protein [Clostridiaceae bacterium]